MFILLLLNASTVYYKKVLERTRLEEGVPNDRSGYRVLLGILQEEGKSNVATGVAGSQGGGQQRGRGEVEEDDEERRSENAPLRTDNTRTHAAGNGAAEDVDDSDRSMATPVVGGHRRATLTLRELNRMKEDEELEQREQFTTAPLLKKPFLLLRNHFFRGNGATVMNELFFLHSPALYFKAVELAMLLQNFYIAMWATNLAYFAGNNRYKVSWEGAMILWMMMNYYLLRRVLLLSCYIHSLYRLDEGIADYIVEQSAEEEAAMAHLSSIIFTELRRAKVPARMWRRHLTELFNNIDRRNTGSLNRTQFRSFLVESGVYASQVKVDFWFTRLDERKLHQILYKDLFKRLFPWAYQSENEATGAAAAATADNVRGSGNGGSVNGGRDGGGSANDHDRRHSAASVSSDNNDDDNDNLQ
jgi:hypothetical protein